VLRTAENSVIASSALVDARPILARRDSTQWSVADDIHDKLFDQTKAACVQMGIIAAVLKSAAYQAKPWVLFEAWIPIGSATQRVHFKIEIDPKLYHKYEVEYKVEMSRGGATKTYGPLARLPDATALVAYLIDRGKKPPFRAIAKSAIVFWKERPNRVVGIRKNWIALAPFILLVVACSTYGDRGSLSVGAGTVGIIWAVVNYFIGRNRPLLVCDGGRPSTEPRKLRLLDSWQVVVSRLGNDAETVLNRFAGAITAFALAGVSYEPEVIGYWGVDGLVERTQHVLTLRRGIVFDQAYQYGDDLYVGWDGHLNAGKWVEKTIDSGITANGKQVRYTTVVPGESSLSEYDLNDANVLMEWTHAQLVRLVKATMAEREIDQEIDFKIVRGNRSGLKAEDSPAKRQGIDAVLGGLARRA